MPPQQYFHNNVYLHDYTTTLALYVSYKCLESYLSVVRNKPKIQQAFPIRRQQSARSRLKMSGMEKK